MNLELNHFKKELSEYQYYQHKITSISNRLLEMEVKRGIRAVQYDKEYTDGSPNPSLIEEKRLDDADTIERLENELESLKGRVNMINDFLKYSEIGDSIMRIHCFNKSTYEIEARRLYMGVRTLKRKVNREILDYVGTGTEDGGCGI